MQGMQMVVHPAKPLEKKKRCESFKEAATTTTITRFEVKYLSPASRIKWKQAAQQQRSADKVKLTK